MLYLGIDQHKRQLTVNLRSEDGTVVLKRQVSTEWEKVRAFFADLAEKARPESGFLAILEVCGMNPWLLTMLQEYGCREIVVVQPTERSKQKTDRRDAGALSHLLWVHRQQFLEGKHPLGLRRVQPPTPQEADDRQITTLRARLTKRRTAVLNGIHKLLRKHNLEQHQPTKLFQTQKVRRWLAADWRGLLNSAIREEELREHARTGCPLGSPEFVARLERAAGRILRPQKPGRPSKLLKRP